MLRKFTAALVTVLAALTAITPFVAADEAPVTLRSLGNGDADARGTYGSTSFFVPVPPGKAVSGPVALDIDFSHSPLLLPDLSTMTVRVNDVSLASTFLTGANANHGHLVVNVPNEIIGAEGMFVETRFYMRLTRDACEDPANPALWATVHGASLVTFPTAFGGSRDVSDVPTLVVPARATDKPLTLVVPNDPNDGVLRAAGVVAATAGRWLGAAGRDAVVATAPEAPADAPSIHVGVLLDVPGVDVRGATRGVIAVAPDGPVRVTVTGPTAAAVLNAARSLSFVEQLDGPVAILTGQRLARDPKRTLPWTKSAASFAQLGLERQEVAGPGTRSVDLVVERPAGWKLTRTGHLDLDLDVATGVRRGPSYVRVTANGFDLGTRRLVPGGGKHTYRFDVAGGLVDRDLRGRPVRSLRLQVTVHLAPENRTCTPLDADAVRATLLPTSKLTLPHRVGDRLDVGRFPSSLTDAMIVLDTNRPDAVATGVQAAASVGRWATSPDAIDDVRLVPVASVKPSERKTNLVVLGNGRSLHNSLVLKEQPVATGSASLVAFAGLKPSPFETDRTALIVQGDRVGTLAAMRAFGSLRGVEGMAGKVVAVLSDSPRAQTLVAETGAAPPVELAPTLTENRIRNETIIGAVLLVAFLAAIILVVRFRWRSPRS